MTQFRRVWTYLTDEQAKELDEKYVVIVYNDPKALFFKYKGDPPSVGDNKT